MNRTAKLLLVALAGLALVCALAKAEVAAQVITVSPANPTISVGQNRQFTATGITSAISVDAGSFHTCVLLQDGALRCWGLNDSGQLGNGTTTSSSTPVAVAGITGAAAVTGGGYHTCARFPDGTLECWGRNDAGQLGDPATTTDVSRVPVRVTGISTATAVTAGGFHTCALLQDGTVRCWGQNTFGQLGNGTILNSFAPVAVSGITTAVAVSAGGWHTCALLQDGTVRCWGRNEDGQLGNGTIIPSLTPVAVSGITTALAVEAGIFDTCTLLQDGTVRCWGRNSEGQLGNGTTTSSSVPVTVSGITPAALAPGAEHSCALFRDGTVRCWGDNNFGQLGNGTAPGTISSIPSAPVTGIATATALASGAVHSCALLPDGSVRCWGQNNFSQLGNGTTTDAFTPVVVTGIGVTWTSSDTTVAVIDGAGLATGRGPGSSAISATSGGRSGSTTVTVVTRPSLTVVREGTGNGTVTSSPAGIDCGTTCSASYDSGTAVTLTATPASGSTFEGWTGGGCAGTGPCTVTLTAGTTVFARFAVPRVSLTVTREGTGSGTVTSSPAGIDCGAVCSASYESGTVVTLTATPATGSTFEGWTGGGCGGTGTCTVTVTGNTAVSARFSVLGLRGLL